ncbi:uncharacterized protein PHALS_11692 [Plasmopara halstedii]|uniref:Uncharacterized protein n=1 Tax=Plasmopara halstedii TaxID=4781 RepID=A0A0P1AJ13_PLAHL|nr:uncharacterized protein PHALS_11692 [Plasmopara halstedii]CEG41341.1 hypothetical protein PHALS_11692 [Plasmopara halstedii]|eukprot:XP_024577710.1 hypothetical protein PHALS_11692 [Plasmopara halstedii]
MAAAEALLAYEPLQHLKHENFMLREENRRIQSEVRELMTWKDKAIAHMTAMAPARQRAGREFERAKQLQQQLRTVESSLQSRSALELATVELKSEREALQLRIEGLERELATLKSQSRRRKRRAEEAEAQLAVLGESFRLHLERLIAMHKKFDGVSKGIDIKTRNKHEEVKHVADNAKGLDINSSDNIHDNAVKQEEVVSELDTDSSSSDSWNSAALVTGLNTAACKCSRWLEGHLTHSFALLQRKAAHYEIEHKEVKRLKEQVEAAGRVPKEIAFEHANQARELVELRESFRQLEQRLKDTERKLNVQQQQKEDMAVRLRFVTGEVRQYLRLVRGEIKRKFGYLPEAVAHAESWARIAEALELLLCQSTLLRDNKTNHSD